MAPLFETQERTHISKHDMLARFLSLLLFPRGSCRTTTRSDRGSQCNAMHRFRRGLRFSLIVVCLNRSRRFLRGRHYIQNAFALARVPSTLPLDPARAGRERAREARIYARARRRPLSRPTRPPPEGCGLDADGMSTRLGSGIIGPQGAPAKVLLKRGDFVLGHSGLACSFFFPHRCQSHTRPRRVKGQRGRDARGWVLGCRGYGP
jgi:hypothetical protein